MPLTRRVVKIFLASPGDLGDERFAARELVDDLNFEMAAPMGIQLELVGWEDTVSQFGRPQAIINRELDQCDLFIGMMWRKWGSPPDSGGPYTSGFEEEFHRAVAKRETTGSSPEIHLLFRDIDPAFLQDPGGDLSKVLDFKQKVIDERKVLFQPFADLRAFERKFRKCIALHLQNLRNMGVTTEPDEVRPQKEVGTAASRREEPLSTSRLLSGDGIAFLRTFVTRAEQASTSGDFTTTDIARIRLIAAAMEGGANDPMELGAHDANQLYLAKDRIDFGALEVEGLFEAGLRSLESENIPMWSWLFKMDRPIDALAFRAIYSSSNSTRRNTIVLMTKAGIEFPNTLLSDHSAFRSSVFSDSEETIVSIRTAALDYLAQVGTEADVPAIESEYAKNSSQTASAAANAIVRIHLRTNRAAALRALVELKAATFDPGLIAALIQCADLDPSVMAEGLKHGSSEIRLATIEWLDEAGLLSDAAVEDLLGDSDIKVRFQGLVRLANRNRPVEPSRVRSVLSEGRSSRGLLRMFGSYSARTDLVDAYEYAQLKRKSLAELNVLVDGQLPIERQATLVRADRFFSKHGDALRALVLDRFESDFETSLARLTSRLVVDDDQIKRLEDLREYTTKTHTRIALAMIASRRDPKDMALVRGAISDPRCDIPLEVIGYLQKLGKWSDVLLVVENEARLYTKPGRSILDYSNDAKNDALARFYGDVGRLRIPELMSIVTSPDILRRIVARLSKSTVQQLSDDTIAGLLSFEHEVVRRVAAIQCVRCLPIRRRESLMKSYLSRGSYFYNVVHWLDLGLSVPAEIRARVASAELEKHRI